MVRSIAFIHYNCSNLNHSIQFYSEVLKLKLLFKQDEWAEFDAPPIRFALKFSKSFVPPPNGPVIWFKTPSIEQEVNYLKNKKVIFHEEIRTYTYGKMTQFYDPDSNILGLYELPLLADDNPIGG